jgi:N utilization substance protein B
MTRRTLRESIFRILFRYEFNSAEEMDEQMEFAIKELTSDDEDDKEYGISSDEEVRNKDKRYITEKSRDVIRHITEIDAIIEEVSDGWKIQRIGKPELAILRLAVYEIKFDDDVPYKTAIDEALELAKVYSPDGRKFINALLAKVQV